MNGSSSKKKVMRYCRARDDLLLCYAYEMPFFFFSCTMNESSIKKKVMRYCSARDDSTNISVSLPACSYRFVHPAVAQLPRRHRLIEHVVQPLGGMPGSRSQ